MRSISRILAALPIVATASACVSLPQSLVEKGVVTIDTEQTGRIYVSSVRVYRDGGETVIRGEARHPISKQFGTFNGHIDIDLTLPDGESMRKHKVGLVRKKVPKTRGRRAAFVARFAVEPPKGTIVRVVYHDGPHGIQPMHNSNTGEL